MAIKRKRLGDLLVESGVITQDQLKNALNLQKISKKKLGQILISQNLVTETKIMEILQLQLGIDFVDLNNIYIEPKLIGLVPQNLAKKYNLIPIKIEQDKLYVAMEDPLDFIAINDVKMVSTMEVVPVISFKDAINNAINKYYGSEYAERAVKEYTRDINLADVANQIQTNSMDDDVNNAPIVRLVNSIIEQAVNMRSSDVHIEPLNEEIRIRYRIDGMLQNILTIPKNALSAIITRIKIIGGMNIAEKRLPQDGRVQITSGNTNIDLRVSTMPTVNGEKAVLRILDLDNFLFKREDLGFSKENLEKFDQLLKNPHGIILVTGPTGSGKTTTLYTMLAELNKIEKNIITIEDPVEYKIQGINQVQVNPKAGLVFANGLRSILRQDPDIIMVGEIRDTETVEIALRAAITGHLVLSTLHTNDAISSISRLLDMGIEPYLMASSMVGVISQRLLRRICANCKTPYTPNSLELSFLGLSPQDARVLYRGKGCSICNQTGYKGRVPAHEILVINKKVREMIGNNVSVDRIRDYCITNGMTSLKDDCVKLVLQGITTVDEALRVAYSQDMYT
ncbi:MAG: GspE/PulE family protein [Mahellales bacterium]|jgi:type IV pilus assembly protein PilB